MDEPKDPVLTTVEDGVMTLQFNRPHDNNRMDSATMARIVAGFDQAEADTSVRLIIVTGDDTYFCGGGRPDGHPNGTLEQRVAYSKLFIRMQEAFARASVPVIARVTGDCVAGGMSILSFCDLAVASEDALFGYPEVKYGQFPALALAVLVPMMAPKDAFEILYSGDRFAASRALELRLVNRVVPRDQVDAAMAEYIESIRAKNRVSVGLGRRAYYAMQPMDPSARLDYAQTFLLAMQSTPGTGQVPDGDEER